MTTRKKPQRGGQRSARPVAEPQQPRYKRRTFMFDGATDAEVDAFQRAIRATTSSEAVRYSVRKIAELTQLVKSGGRVMVDLPKKGMMTLDIPAANP